MIYVAGYRGAMSIAGQCNRAGYRVTIQRVQTFSVRTYSGVTAAMGWLFFPGDITIHLDDQEIQRRLDTVHKLLFDGGMIYAPFPNTFPAILVAPSIFAVDSFDHALNPRLAKKMIQVFCEQVIQHKKHVFLT